MGMRMTMSFSGDVQLDRTLVRMAHDVADARPIWEVIAQSFQRSERRNFKSQGAYASGTWAPLSPAYAAWKARAYPGTKILERTGDLKKSLTERPFGVEVIEPTFIVLGTDIAYAEYHQNGTDKMPQRRPVEFTESLRRDWMKLIQSFLTTGRA